MKWITVMQGRVQIIVIGVEHWQRTLLYIEGRAYFIKKDLDNLRSIYVDLEVGEGQEK